MIWLTFRQHRTELLIIGGTLAVLAVLFLFTGLDMHAAYQQLGVGACLTDTGQNPLCPNIIDSFRQQYGFWQGLLPWLNLLPALFGVLIGVPLLAREYEQGTQRLAWTQSITRRRWLLIKLGVVLAATLILTAAFSALITWWNGPFDQLDGHFTPTSYDFEGIVPLAFATFSLALGVATGALLRRVIPAIAATTLYIPLRLLDDAWLRQRLIPPLKVTFDVLSKVPTSRQDWFISQNYVDQQGNVVSAYQVYATCGSNGHIGQSALQCIHDQGWMFQEVYQPASRYWPFQALEAGLFFAAALLLLGLTVWLVERRVA